MHFHSTIIIPCEHRGALFQEFSLASGYTAATQDWEILNDWYGWSCNERGDGALISIQPGRSGKRYDLLSPQEKSRPYEWLEVCNILARYTPEGSLLEWNDGDHQFFRFLFTEKKVVFQIGEILYQDQSFPLVEQEREVRAANLSGPCSPGNDIIRAKAALVTLSQPGVWDVFGDEEAMIVRKALEMFVNSRSSDSVGLRFTSSVSVSINHRTKGAK